MLRVLWILFALLFAEQTDVEENDPSMSSGHANNWAVLVCTSAFWFNYRHVANVLSVYRMAKSLGIPDDHIILMLADDMACNGRNIFQGQVFGGLDRSLNLYGEDVEVDYRGCEVTVEMFIRLLTSKDARLYIVYLYIIDRLPPDFPKSKRLLTDSGSNILVFMTGHGGDNFLKFQDSEEINAYDLADAFEEMWTMNRYNEILFVIDTCQASTMFERFRSPNIMAISSSARGESSYSYHVDDDLGVAIIDRFTYSLLNYLRDLNMHSKKTIQNFMDSLDLHFLGSTPELRDNFFNRPASKVKLVDFFGNIKPVQLDTEKAAPIYLKGAPSDTRIEFEEEPVLRATAEPNNYKAFDISKQPNVPLSSYLVGGISTLLLIYSAIYML